MANNLRKFNTYSDYEAAELVKPAVSLIVATDEVYFDQKDAPVPPTPSLSGLTVYYNITDILQPTELFKYGGGSGSGSGSGSGGVLPSAMVIDGTEFYPTPTYQFDTVGEHIVQYSFVDNKIPDEFLYDIIGEKFNTVTKVVIGDAITTIGDEVFERCSGLTSCTIGDNVTTIGDSAFGGCSSITSIDIPSGVTSIGGGAFYSCTSLSSITISSGVTTIGGAAFNGCTSLTSINIPNSVTSIGVGVFYSCTSLTSINIPSGVTSIGDAAFYQCSSLTSIVSNAATAPTISSNTFQNVHTNGTLTVPSSSSGYDVWMQNANYYLGLYNWTKVEQ